jgi:lipopolysaccharide/colanic/teichoic acid biosynthesis glycosyltransferase
LFKRLFDIIFSSIALILLSPVLVAVSIAIVTEDKCPILFKQKRAGLHDNSFNIYKFRSMRLQKDSVEKKNSPTYNWENGVPDDFVFKTDGFNPNVTKVGRFIRKTSVDELPQFFNVLLGNMSVIGPRPEIIEITKCYNIEQKQRLLVKPGITGWAQVNGRSESNHGEKINNDLYYVENRSMFLDAKILFMTIYQTLFGKGAI